MSGVAKKKVAKKKVAKKKVAKKKVAKKKAAKKKAAKKKASKKKASKKKASKKVDVPDSLLGAFETRLPVHGEGFVLELASVTRFDWGIGLHGVLRLTHDDAGGPRSQEAEVPLLRSDDLGAVDWSEIEAALDRWCARVRAMTAAESERLGIDGLAPWAEVDPEELERRYAAYVATARPETPAATEQRRQAALAAAFAAFPRLAEHVQAVWDLKLPRTLAVYHAFHLALVELPSAVRGASCTSPGGILDRLAPRGWERAVREGLDERGHCRFRRDPPEMLTFAWGEGDGLHFGLWYDTADAAIAVVLNYARDSAETWLAGDHPLSVCRHRWQYDPPSSDETGFAIRLYLEELAWFEAQELRVAEPTSSSALGRRNALLGGPGSIPGAKLPLDVERRADAFRKDPHTVRAWVAQAREALENGKPALALALGRELHWFDGDAYREEAGALLLAAYEALGRTAHAGILRAHLAQRDQRSVDVLEYREDAEQD